MSYKKGKLHFKNLNHRKLTCWVIKKPNPGKRLIGKKPHFLATEVPYIIYSALN